MVGTYYKLRIDCVLFGYQKVADISLHSERFVSIMVPSPFHSQDLINNTLYCLLYSSYDISLDREFGGGSVNNLLIDIFLYSHHLSTRYCIDIVWRNSVLVTCGS